MEDIRFQIKLPGYEEEEDSDKKSKPSEEPKAEQSDKQAPAGAAGRRGRGRGRRSSAERCDRCCYCCVLCCESVFFTIGSAIKILMSVVVVGLMFWTALYVYTINSKDNKRVVSPPGGGPEGGGILRRGLARRSDGYSNSSGSSGAGGLEANGGLPRGLGDFHKPDSGLGGSDESGVSFLRKAESDDGSNSPRDPGGGSVDLGGPSGSPEGPGDARSDRSCADDPACVSSDGPAESSDDTGDSRRVSSDLTDPGDGPDSPDDASDGPGDLVDKPSDPNEPADSPGDSGEDAGDAGGGSVGPHALVASYSDPSGVVSFGSVSAPVQSGGRGRRSDGPGSPQKATDGLHQPTPLASRLKRGLGVRSHPHPVSRSTT